MLGLTEVDAAPKRGKTYNSHEDSCGKNRKNVVVTTAVPIVTKKPDILAELIAEKLALEAKIKALLGL